jgi:hypothetical protein
MSTKLNYTRRLEISPESVAASVVESAPSIYALQIEWDFSAYELEKGFRLIFVLKAIGETFRHPHKHLDDVKNSLLIPLAGMRNPLDLNIRIKVVSDDVHGVPVVQAQVKTLSPEVPERFSKKRSLLGTKNDDTLAVPWRLYFTDGVPVLHISNQHGLYTILDSQTPEFDPMILPEVVRQIFIWLATSRDDKDVVYSDGWKRVFNQFGCGATFFDSLKEFHELTEAERQDLVNRSYELSDAFCEEMQYLELLKQINEGNV